MRSFVEFLSVYYSPTMQRNTEKLNYITLKRLWEFLKEKETALRYKYRHIITYTHACSRWRPMKRTSFLLYINLFPYCHTQNVYQAFNVCVFSIQKDFILKYFILKMIVLFVFVILYFNS